MSKDESGNDGKGIDDKYGLLEEDLEFKKKLMIYFVKTSGDKISEINKLINEEKIDNAHRLAHTMKGNAAQLGKIHLQRAAADVESGLKNGKNEVTKEQLKTLEVELNAVLLEFNKSKQDAAENGADAS